MEGSGSECCNNTEVHSWTRKHVKKTILGSGSKCCDNTEVHSWTRKVQLATFGGCTKGETKEDHFVCVLHQAWETEQYNEVLNESKIGRLSESLKLEKKLVFFEEESVSPSSSLEPPNRKSSEVDISIKVTGDALLVVEDSPVKDHPMSQVGNLPWARIGSLFQTPTVCLIQHSPNWSQGQTALFLVKSTCGPTHNANKGNQWVATMWFSWLQRPMKVFCQNMQIGMKMGVRVDFGETVIWNLYVINLLFSTLRTRLCFRRGGIVRIMRKGELVTTVRILIS